MQDNNTLTGIHIKATKNGELKFGPKKYNWHIPKAVRHLSIQPGDIVTVGRKRTPVLVVEVFRENIEDTGRTYKSIQDKLS